MPGAKDTVSRSMALPWPQILLLAAVLLIAASLPAGAEDPAANPSTTPSPSRPVPPTDGFVEVNEVVQPARPHPKLGSSLNQLLEVRRRQGVSGGRAFAATHRMVLDGDRVQVVVEATPEAIPRLRKALDALGVETQARYQGDLQALVPVAALQELTSHPDLLRIREPYRAVRPEPGPGRPGDQPPSDTALPQAPTSLAGPGAVSQGVVASNAQAWHKGYDGAGVRVAVIDAGFDDYQGLLGNELPGSVGTYRWVGGDMGGTLHGTACAEIVHDMAPAAQIDLYKISTRTEFGQAVDQTLADGVDIISMSMGWVAGGPGDGTWKEADMVRKARADGILLVKSAGNFGKLSWHGTYVNYRQGNQDYHAWDGAQRWLNWILSADGNCDFWETGGTISAGLTWDDWTSMTQDYDLHLFRWPGTGSTLYRVASSTHRQNENWTPKESLQYTAQAGNCYGFAVERVDATRDVCLRLLTHAEDAQAYSLDEWIAPRSLASPADAAEAVAVGAVDVDAPFPLEPYSSQGPTMGPGGGCSGGEIKPDTVAYANVDTATYGPGEMDGTSAATPHVAGAAALVKQANPGFGPDQLQRFLESRAIDQGSPGKDNQFGWGRLWLGTPPGSRASTVFMPLIAGKWPKVRAMPLEAIGDNMVLQGYPDVVLTSQDHMWVGYDHCLDGGIARSLLEFNTHQIPAGATLVKATLKLRQVVSCDTGPRTHTVTAYRIRDDMGVDLITWRNQSRFAEAYGSAAVTSFDWSWYALDVTGLVRGWVDGSLPNYGIMLRGPEGSGNESAALGFGTMQNEGESKTTYIDVIYRDSGVVRQVLLPARARKEPPVAPGLSIPQYPRATGETATPGFVLQSEGLGQWNRTRVLPMLEPGE